METEIWEDIHTKEKEIYLHILRIDEAGPEISQPLVESLAKLIAGHSRMINEALQIYSTIDYFEQTHEKITFKANLKYSSQILDFCSNLIRLFDKSDSITPEIVGYIQAVEELIVYKERKMRKNYIPAAKDELVSFHNQEFRNQLELDLASKLASHLKKDNEISLNNKDLKNNKE